MNSSALLDSFIPFFNDNLNALEKYSWNVKDTALRKLDGLKLEGTTAAARNIEIKHKLEEHCIRELLTHSLNKGLNLA